MEATDRAKLRERALGAKRTTPLLVEHDGATYEVRRPSIRERGDITQAAKIETAKGDAGQTKVTKIDPGLMQALAIVRLTYVPGTDIKVFEDADLEVLQAQEVGGVADAIWKVAAKLINVEPTSLGKPSAQTPPDNSASE